MKHNFDVLGQLALFTVVPTEIRTIVHDPYWDEVDIAPEQNTHWVEKYWVQRNTNKYWYFRYCWMVGRKKNRVHLGSVNSILAKRKKADIEVWISDGKLPVEIKKLIRGCKNEQSPK